MSPVNLLKGGATGRTRIGVNLLCADKRLTCGSYPPCMHIQHGAAHTSLTRSLGLASALICSPKRSASTSGSPLTSSSSGSHPIQTKEILSPEVFRPSPRWFDQLAFDPPGCWSVSVWGGRGVMCPQGWQRGYSCSCRCRIWGSCGGPGLGCDTKTLMGQK